MKRAHPKLTVLPEFYSMKNFGFSTSLVADLYSDILEPFTSEILSFLSPVFEQNTSLSVASLHGGISEPDILYAIDVLVYKIMESHFQSKFVLLKAFIHGNNFSAKTIASIITEQWSLNRYYHQPKKYQGKHPFEFRNPPKSNKNLIQYISSWSRILQKQKADGIFFLPILSVSFIDRNLLSAFFQTLPFLPRIHYFICLIHPILFNVVALIPSNLRSEATIFTQDTTLKMWPAPAICWNKFNSYLHEIGPFIYSYPLLQWLKHGYLNTHSSLYYLKFLSDVCLFTYHLHCPLFQHYLNLTIDEDGDDYLEDESYGTLITGSLKNIDEFFNPETVWKAKCYLPSVPKYLAQIVDDDPTTKKRVKRILSTDESFCSWLNSRITKMIQIYQLWHAYIRKLHSIFPSIDWYSECCDPNVSVWCQIPAWNRIFRPNSSFISDEVDIRRKTTMKYLSKSGDQLCNLSIIAGYEFITVSTNPKYLANLVSPPIPLFVHQALSNPFVQPSVTLASTLEKNSYLFKTIPCQPPLVKKYWPSLCLTYSLMPNGDSISLNDWYSNFKMAVSSLMVDSIGRGRETSYSHLVKAPDSEFKREFGRNLVGLGELGVLLGKKLKYLENINKTNDED